MSMPNVKDQMSNVKCQMSSVNDGDGDGEPNDA